MAGIRGGPVGLRIIGLPGGFLAVERGDFRVGLPGIGTNRLQVERACGKFDALIVIPFVNSLENFKRMLSGEFRLRDAAVAFDGVLPALYRTRHGPLGLRYIRVECLQVGCRAPDVLEWIVPDDIRRFSNERGGDEAAAEEVIVAERHDAICPRESRAACRISFGPFQVLPAGLGEGDGPENVGRNPEFPPGGFERPGEFLGGRLLAEGGGREQHNTKNAFHALSGMRDGTAAAEGGVAPVTSLSYSGRRHQPSKLWIQALRINYR